MGSRNARLRDVRVEERGSSATRPTRSAPVPGTPRRSLPANGPFWSANAKLSAECGGHRRHDVAGKQRRSTFLTRATHVSRCPPPWPASRCSSRSTTMRACTSTGSRLPGPQRCLVGSPLAFGTTPPGDATYASGEYIIHEGCPVRSEYQVSGGRDPGRHGARHHGHRAAIAAFRRTSTHRRLRNLQGTATTEEAGGAMRRFLLPLAPTSR